MLEGIERTLARVRADLDNWMPGRGLSPDVTYRAVNGPPYDVSFTLGGFRSIPAEIDRRFFQVGVHDGDNENQRRVFHGSKQELLDWLGQPQTPSMVENGARELIESLEDDDW